MNRTNRRQNIMELVACDPASRQVPRHRPRGVATGWVDNSPQMRYLADSKRFIWESERNGFTNYYLYDLSGKLINPITTHDEVRGRRRS